ncbi:MAG TPA: carboxypeptidase regulatory-like domain-containing protein, partial [Thermoanaerobaculia bacterium]
MKRRQWLIGILMVLMSASSSFAQGLPSGTLTGVVTHDGQGLPGVTVTVSSPALQGTRTEVTRESGEYIFPFLPPGDYTVSFVLSGFQQQTVTAKIAAAQTQRVNVALSMTAVTESITVTASQQTVSEDQQAALTFQQEDFVEKLPIARDMDSVVALAPGVHLTGPRSGGQNQITISGAHSYENLFLLNGVVINENLRGQSLPLYIEDAIQETTIATAGISAEYGRFAGGVVNAITKSGGNEFSGSFRTNLTNDSWVGETPLTVSRADSLNKSFEGTLGGRILRDRLWFFAAGRSVESEVQNQTSFTSIPFTTTNTQDRYEAKLTLSASPRHNFVGSFIGIDQATNGTYFTSAPILDTRSLVNREDPQELKALHYNGVLT